MTTLSITIKDSILKKLHDPMKRFGVDSNEKFLSKAIEYYVEALSQNQDEDLEVKPAKQLKSKANKTVYIAKNKTDIDDFFSSIT